jgi:hypothetical protein
MATSTIITKKNERSCNECGSQTTTLHKYSTHADGSVAIYKHWFKDPVDKTKFICKNCRVKLYDSPAYKARQQELKKKKEKEEKKK